VRARLAKTVRVCESGSGCLRTGLEVFEAIFSARTAPPAHRGHAHFVPIHIEYGVAVFQGRPGQRYYNPLGTVHGGCSQRSSIRQWVAPCIDAAAAGGTPRGNSN